MPADENREYCTDVNVIPIDSIYTPIRNVKYSVENFRVEQKTDYEKLVLEISTDGSIPVSYTPLLFVAIYRFGSYVVLPGINPAMLAKLHEQTREGLLALLNMFSRCV